MKVACRYEEHFRVDAQSTNENQHTNPDPQPATNFSAHANAKKPEVRLRLFASDLTLNSKLETFD
jgi:hypothetical protein